MLKKALFKIKGMQRDLSESAFNPEFAYENMNLRIVATDDNTQLSLTNEKGPLKAEIMLEDEFHPNEPTKEESLIGQMIGQCKIENYLIVFTTLSTLSNPDRIYKLYFKNGWIRAFLLYEGNLNFSTLNPIETLALYENDLIKKVYWTDGRNQPRVINIEVNKKYPSNYSFDFTKELLLKENIKVERNDFGNGIFAPGVILYAFSYYNRYGLESNIFHQSFLNYTSYSERGGSPEEKVSNSFTITMSNLDTNFEYIRVYSIFRSSINGVPEVKLVRDLKVSNNTITLVDNGTIGEFVDPTLLLYIGGEEIIAGTLNLKDNTLFLGNIQYKRLPITKDIKNFFRLEGIIDFQYKENPYKATGPQLYPYLNLLKKNSSLFKTFKRLETYRFGLLFLHISGKWSEPIFIEDAINNIKPGSQTNSKICKAVANFSTSNLINTLISMGYSKARPVIVYPSMNDRSVICLGILCPTVYNVGDRMSNSPYVQSSWFARANYSEDFSNANLAAFSLNGFIPEFRHNYSLPDSEKRNAEIQTNRLSLESASSNDFTPELNKDIFFVDLSIVTLHSPDIEFDDSILNLDLSDTKLRIVGYSILSSTMSDLDIQTESPVNTFSTVEKGIPKGFVKQTLNSAYSRGRMLVSNPFWFDALFNPEKGTLIDNTSVGDLTYGFAVYPWHRKGSLNNTKVKDDKGYKSALLKYKKMSNLRSSLSTTYLSDTLSYGLSDAKVFNSNELGMITLKSNTSNSDKFKGISYYGNIDKVINTSYKDGYRIKVCRPKTSDQTDDLYFSTEYDNLRLDGKNSKETGVGYGVDPVRMKYKSTPHIVLSLEGLQGVLKILPTTVNSLNIPVNSIRTTNNAFWDNHTYDVVQPSVKVTLFDSCYLWVGELYRTNVVNRFGGTSEEAISNNLWLPCGESVRLTKDNGFTLEWTEGDTYYLRYDHLKTYPFTLEDDNSITEIISFMCETRVNLDGRYDNNRGLINNLVTTPKIFNLMNPVYSQENNFFNYRASNSNRLNVTKFNNTITWSKTKTLGELVDTWTNTTLASTLDLDGNKGLVRALKRFNNNLIAFLDTGISLILYNENTQISTTEGVPIEIANSGKVLGKRYISDRIGCTNKWSICEAPSGLYFIDDITKNIYLFNGLITSLSDKFGFHSWINKRSNNLKVWNPDSKEGFKNGVSYYDNLNGDIFFIYYDTCLAFSEALGGFSSFYSYENTPYFINLEDKGLFFKTTDDLNTSIWLHNLGDYNIFFDKYKPFYTNIIVNQDPTIDKTFSNLEFSSDSWYGDILMNETFDTIQVYNEYLDTGKVDLIRLRNRPANTKKKFRVWRIDIPRDKSNYRDRIRNPWVYLKLSREKFNTYKTVLHDMLVSYIL